MQRVQILYYVLVVCHLCMYGQGTLGVGLVCNTICFGLRLVVITVFGFVLVVHVATFMCAGVTILSEKSVSFLLFFINW